MRRKTEDDIYIYSYMTWETCIENKSISFVGWAGLRAAKDHPHITPIDAADAPFERNLCKSPAIRLITIWWKFLFLLRITVTYCCYCWCCCCRCCWYQPLNLARHGQRIYVDLLLHLQHEYNMSAIYYEMAFSRIILKTVYLSRPPRRMLCAHNVCNTGLPVYQYQPFFLAYKFQESKKQTNIHTKLTRKHS